MRPVTAARLDRLCERAEAYLTQQAQAERGEPLPPVNDQLEVLKDILAELRAISEQLDGLAP